MAELKVGAIFSKLSDLEAAIANYEQSQLVNMYKRSSRSIESHRKRCPNVAETANKDLIFAELVYCCIHGGKNFKSHGKGQRQAHHTTQQQCPAGFRIRLSKDATKLVVANLNEEHNHQMNEALFKFLPRQRRLDPAMEAETGRLLTLHANKKLVQQEIRDQGKEVTLKDLHNIKARTRPSHSNKLQALLTEMRNEDGAVTELVLGSSNELVAISYQDSKMRTIQARFPELLLLDATYKLNDMRMPLYVLMVVDGNGESVVVALWIVANEERATISGLMDIFIKHNDADNIKCVMADKDMTERDVIREKLPGAALQICLFHTLRTFRREVTSEKLGIRSDERPKGAEMTVVGLPKKRKILTRPVPFLKKSPEEKESIIIHWFVKADVAETALNGGELISARAVEKRPEKVPMKVTDENVDLNRVRKYFTVAGWNALLCVVGKVTQKGVWKCKVCDGDVDSGLSLGCDACLDWFHGRCVGISTAPKKATWICNGCHACL